MTLREMTSCCSRCMRQGCNRSRTRQAPAPTGRLDTSKLRDDAAEGERSWREILRASFLVVCFFVLGLMVIGIVMDRTVMDAGPSYFTTILVMCGVLASALSITRYLITSPLAGEFMDLSLFVLLLVLTHVFTWHASTIRFSSHSVAEEVDQMVDDENQLPGTSIVLHLDDVAAFGDVYSWINTVSGNFVCDDKTLHAAGPEVATCFINDGRYLRISPFRVRVQKTRPGLLPDRTGGTRTLFERADASGALEAVSKRQGLVSVTPGTEMRGNWTGSKGMVVPWIDGTFQQMGTKRHIKPLDTWGFYQDYHPGGFVVEFGANLTANGVAALAAQLEDNEFLDPFTRVLIAEVLVLRVDVGIWAQARVTIEMPTSGGFYVRKVYRTGLLPERPAFVGKDGRFAKRLLMPGSELFYLMTILVLALCFSEGLSATRDIYAYMRDGSNLVDLVTLMLCVVAFGLRAAADFYLPKSLATLNAPPWSLHGTSGDPFPSINTSAWCTEWMRTTITLALFMLYSRILKYLQRVPGLDVIQRTFKRASGDLAAFAFVFLVVFIAYAIALELIFGQELRDFRSFFRTLHTLLRALTGDLDAAAMFEDERVIGFISLLTFNLLVVFTLLTLLVAILSDAFIIEKAAIGHMKRKQRIRELTAFVGRSISTGNSALEVASRSLRTALKRVHGTTRTLLASQNAEVTQVNVVLWSASGLLSPDPLTEPDPYVLLHVLANEETVMRTLSQGTAAADATEGGDASDKPPPLTDSPLSFSSAVVVASQRERNKGAAAGAGAASDAASDSIEAATKAASEAGSIEAGSRDRTTSGILNRLNAARSVQRLRDGVRQVVVGEEEVDKLLEPRRVYRFPEQDATTDPEWHDQCQVNLRPYEVPSATKHGQRGACLVFTVWDLQAGTADRMLGITAFPMDLLPRNGEPVTADLHLQREGWTPTAKLPPTDGRGHLHVSLSLRLLKSAASRLVSVGVRGVMQQRGHVAASSVAAGLRRGVFPAWSPSGEGSQSAAAGAATAFESSARNLRRMSSSNETANPIIGSQS